MNPYCPSCGTHLRFDGLHGWFACPNCGKVRTALQVNRAWDPKVTHGERCQSCEGTGTQERTFEEGHPYGDTIAIERLTEEVDCEDCGGKGYFLDERGKTCVICGRDIPDGTGVLVNGWRVHEDLECSTDDPPRLTGWDG